MEKEIEESVDLKQHRIVSQEQWTEEHRQHLKEAKEMTRLYDRKLVERRALPWVKVEKNYVFEGPNGKVTLADLFENRSQLVVQHFMFGPEDEEGCVGCSFNADHVDAARMHFEHNDLSFAAISRGPIEKLQAYKRRMGWKFNWVSSLNNDFNFDFHVSFTKEEMESGRVYYNFEFIETDSPELPGNSVFYKDENGNIFHTQSSYGRGDEKLIGAYNYLDNAPKGRNENGPEKDLTDWVRRHDKYDHDTSVEDQNSEDVIAQSCCSSSEAKS